MSIKLGLIVSIILGRYNHTYVAYLSSHSNSAPCHVTAKRISNRENSQLLKFNI
jgi:hypothetical protein